MGNHNPKVCNIKLQQCRKCSRGIHHTTLCKSYDNKATKVPGSKTTQAQSREEDHTEEHQPSMSNVNHVNVTTTSRHTTNLPVV